MVLRYRKPSGTRQDLSRSKNPIQIQSGATGDQTFATERSFEVGGISPPESPNFTEGQDGGPDLFKPLATVSQGSVHEAEACD